jgi:hypothetical protein
MTSYILVSKKFVLRRKAKASTFQRHLGQLVSLMGGCSIGYVVGGAGSEEKVGMTC